MADPLFLRPLRLRRVSTSKGKLYPSREVTPPEGPATGHVCHPVGQSRFSSKSPVLVAPPSDATVRLGRLRIRSTLGRKRCQLHE